MADEDVRRNRKRGFYWVRDLSGADASDGWVIAEWSPVDENGARARWHFVGWEVPQMFDPDEVDERPLVRERLG